MAETAKKISMIPAKVQYDRNVKLSEKKMKVAAYCRVSTELEEQDSSYEAQVEYYTSKISENENWKNAGIYADDGKSGTNTKKRADFNAMIQDALAGKIDMILTKSVSRFARNTVDSLVTIRKLKEKNVAVVFEKEGINTLEGTGEILITILSSLAQEESRNISENIRWGVVRKFEKGKVIVNCTKFMGYTKNEDGDLVIVPEEAEIVKLIFRLYLEGYSTGKIAKHLEEQGIKTATGQDKWHSTVIDKMLRNEKYMGDALLQKTYTADFLTKRQVKNNGEVAQVYVKDSHKGIIDKETWNAVQEEFDRRKKFMQRHGTDRYSYGSECYPFCEKIFCGECGSLFTRHSWKSRGIVQWQCKNHRKDGKVACTNAYVDNANLENGFVKAFNRLVSEREKHMERWNAMKADGTPLEKIRAVQMMEATENGQLQKYVPEAAQLVLEEITIFGAKKYEFAFLEGSRVKVSV